MLAKPCGEGTHSDEFADKKSPLCLIECVDQAVAASPTIKTWTYEVAKARDEQRMALSSLGPSMSVTFQHNQIKSTHDSGPSDIDYVDQATRYCDVSVSQPIFSGVSATNRYRQSKLNTQWVALRKDQAIAEVVLNVQTTFLNLLRAKEDVTRFQKTVERLKQLLDVVNAYHRLEMAPYVQVLQSEVDLADAQQRLSRAENDLETETIQLNVLIGESPDAPTVFEGNLNDFPINFTLPLTDCLNHAFSHRPDLLAAQKNLHVAEKGVDIELGSFYPSVSVDAHYISKDRDYSEFGRDILGNEYDRDQLNEYWTVGLSLRWTFFESGRKFHSYNRAHHEVLKQKEVLRTIEDQIKSQVRTYYLRMDEAKRRIGVMRKATSAAQENFDRARKRYELQLATNQEVLEAQDRLTRSETELNQALVDYQVALANLYFTIGLKNPSLQPVAIKGTGDI